VRAELREALARAGVPAGRAYNLAWMDALNLENYLDVSGAIVASALARKESRGSHYRADFPEKDDAGFLCNLLVTRYQEQPAAQAVEFSRVRPDEHRPSGRSG
jgi:succinate dehydrogenase/fumarate reductase flavoprotein subunit